MARNRTNTPQPAHVPQKSKAQLIAEINARHQTGDLTAEEAQAEIDELNGVTRVIDDQAGEVAVTDARVDPTATPTE